MNHLYLFTLEVAPLKVGQSYDDLPSHLTLMSRFWSELSPKELATIVRPLFHKTMPLNLVFGQTVELGPKKLMVHIVRQPKESILHDQLLKLLDTVSVDYQYPQFIGRNHKPHVTKREGMHFAAGDEYKSSAVYLIEVIDSKRVIRSRFQLSSR